MVENWKDLRMRYMNFNIVSNKEANEISQY